MNARKLPPAPVGVSKASKAWWRAVLAEYELEPHLLRVLESACTAWDRMKAASAQLESDGLFLRDKSFNLRAHPAIAVERDARIAFLRSVRELALEVGNPDGRPPRVGTGART